MKVYWIENSEGKKYGTARYFTSTGVPKLYGTRERAERIVKERMNWRLSIQRDVFTVKEGELHETDGS